MIGLGYSLAESFNPTSTEAQVVVDGRVSLLSLVVHVQGITTNFAIEPLVFRNKDASGDVRYKFRPWCIKNATGPVFNHLSYQVHMGSAGILFEEGIYFEWEAAGGSDEGVDNVVLFYM